MDELWKVSPGKYISTEQVSGMYLGKEEYGHLVWNGWDEELIEDWNDEDEVIILDNKVDLDKLVEAQVCKITSLAKDGWRLGEDNKFLNIEDELDKLRVYVEVQKIVGCKERA